MDAEGGAEPGRHDAPVAVVPTTPVAPAARVESRRLRVLEVVPYYAPAWAFGGPPRVMYQEALELVRRGHSVEVITTDALDGDGRVQAAPVSIEDGVTVRRFRNLSNTLAYRRYRFLPRGMRAALRGAHADVVHLSEMRHEPAIMTWGAVRRSGTPLVISAHGTLPRRSGWKSVARRAYDHRWVTPMLAGSAACFAQTRHEADLYVEQGVPAARVHLVPLGVGEPAAPGTPASLDVPADARVVLFLGRLHPLKGADRLITAFARVAPRHPDTVLVIAGRDDGALADLRRLATDRGVGARVHFPGAVYGDARFDLYRRADLFAITPTHFEETSLASLEAASTGTALLVGAEAEAPFLDAYGAGATVAAAADVAPVLDALLASDLKAMGVQAARMVRERHAWARVGDVVESIFTDVAR